MEKQRAGGFTVFSPTIRPNIFSEVGVDDLIERQGESVLWFQMQPCPCPKDEKTPDCNLCFDGMIKTYQESILQEKEKILTDGNIAYTRYIPIKKILKLKHPDGKDINFRSFDENKIYLDRFYKNFPIIADYEVSLLNKKIINCSIDNEYKIYFNNLDGYIINIEEIYFNGILINKEEYDFGYNFISFINRITGNLTIKLILFPKIKVAYKTYNSEEKNQGKVGILLQNGEVELIVPHKYKIGKGDILVFTTAEQRHSEVIQSKGKIDFLSHIPVFKILKVFSKKKLTSGKEIIKEYKENIDFILKNDYSIYWLNINNKPEYYSIIYLYHPTFIVQSNSIISGGMDRNLPKQIIAKQINSYLPTK